MCESLQLSRVAKSLWMKCLACVNLIIIKAFVANTRFRWMSHRERLNLRIRVTKNRKKNLLKLQGESQDQRGFGNLCELNGLKGLITEWKTFYLWMEDFLSLNERLLSLNERLVENTRINLLGSLNNRMKDVTYNCKYVYIEKSGLESFISEINPFLRDSISKSIQEDWTLKESEQLMLCVFRHTEDYSVTALN